MKQSQCVWTWHAVNLREVRLNLKSDWTFLSGTGELFVNHRNQNWQRPWECPLLAMMPLQMLCYHSWSAFFKMRLSSLAVFTSTDRVIIYYVLNGAHLLMHVKRISVILSLLQQYHVADSCTSLSSFSALLSLSQKFPDFYMFICFLPVCVPLHLSLSHFTLLFSDYVSSLSG